MEKITLGPQLFVCAFATTLVGVDIDGKPSFMAVSNIGIANHEPPMISIAIRYHRYTYKGIKANMTFSVNIPSVDLIKETDYCGLVSGSKANKVEVCKFEVFYGKLKHVPLIAQCPANLECKVTHILGLESHALIIGKVEETHIDKRCLTDGKPDITKINGFSYSKDPFSQYLAFGQVIGKALSIGHELK
jgi:flavin reductase (DIM6/NTAB) family NADH-FMN oxidoreductase RutF